MRNFGENINRYERITHQCVTVRGQRGHNGEIEKRHAGRKPRRTSEIILQCMRQVARKPPSICVRVCVCASHAA